MKKAIEFFLKNETENQFKNILKNYINLSKEEKEELCDKTKNFYYKGIFYSESERILESLYFLGKYFNFKKKFKDEELLNYCTLIMRSGALNYLNENIIKKLNGMGKKTFIG